MEIRRSERLCSQLGAEPKVGQTPSDLSRRIVRKSRAQAGHSQLSCCQIGRNDHFKLPRRRGLAPQLNQHPLGFGAGVFGESSHVKKLAEPVPNQSILGETPTPTMLQACTTFKPSRSASANTSSDSAPGLSQSSSHPLAAISGRTFKRICGGK